MSRARCRTARSTIRRARPGFPPAAASRCAPARSGSGEEHERGYAQRSSTRTATVIYRTAPTLRASLAARSEERMRRTRKRLRTALVAACGAVAVRAAWPATGAPESANDSASASASSANDDQEVTVTAERLNLIGTATTASEGVVVASELALTPAFRPGALLETVPGLTVTSHSGEGKANQYMMRGFDLDHGTDLAVFVDGMPVNEPTHAHGQGYADLNFLIPELATNLQYTKGTYYAEQGDFASVGSIHINYLD